MQTGSVGSHPAWATPGGGLSVYFSTHFLYNRKEVICLISDFFHWLWYDFWGYGYRTEEVWIGAVFIGYYLIRWALNGFRIPRYREKNMNTHREFHDFM